MQAIENPRNRYRFAAQAGVGQRKNIVTGIVAEIPLDVIQTHFGRAIQHGQLVDFLRASEQISLHQVRQQIHHARAGPEAFHLHAPAYPRRPLRRLRRINGDDRASALQRLDPFGFARLLVELAAAHDKHGIGGRPRRDLHENLGPGFARFSGGQSQLHQPAFGEERQRLGGVEKPVPVKTAFHRQHLTLEITGGMRRVADRAGAFLHEQLFFAVHKINRRESALEVAQQLISADLHDCPLV